MCVNKNLFAYKYHSIVHDIGTKEMMVDNIHRSAVRREEIYIYES
jgi:hypothetical protein